MTSASSPAPIDWALGVGERAHALGLEGVFFRSVLTMSPRLDPGRPRAIRQRADDLGLYEG